MKSDLMELVEVAEVVEIVRSAGAEDDRPVSSDFDWPADSEVV